MSGLSAVQRTIRELKNQGVICGIVEKYVPVRKLKDGGKDFGFRRDLFGIIDIIALDTERGVRGIQCCGSDFSGHLIKITEEKAQESINWLQTPGTVLEIWGWRKIKLKRGGKAMRWSPRIREITLEDFGEQKKKKDYQEYLADRF